MHFSPVSESDTKISKDSDFNTHGVQNNEKDDEVLPITPTEIMIFDAKEMLS